MATLYPMHDVGDIVYFYDKERDAVIRAKIKRITAECTKPGGEFRLQYVVRTEWAGADTYRRDWTLDEERVEQLAREAFPELPPAVPSDESAEVHG